MSKYAPRRQELPFRKEPSDLDVTFEDGTADSEYLSTLTATLPQALDRPAEIVFYLAGSRSPCDAALYRGDQDAAHRAG